MTVNGEWMPADWLVVIVDGRPMVKRGAELMTLADAVALRDLLCTTSKRKRP